MPKARKIKRVLSAPVRRIARGPCPTCGKMPPAEGCRQCDSPRGLIDGIVLTPGEKRGELGKILEWTGSGTEMEKTDTRPSRECRSRWLRGQDLNLRPSGHNVTDATGRHASHRLLTSRNAVLRRAGAARASHEIACLEVPWIMPQSDRRRGEIATGLDAAPVAVGRQHRPGGSARARRGAGGARSVHDSGRAGAEPA